MKNAIIRRLIALGDTPEKAQRIYELYKAHDDLEILLRTIEARETPEPIDKHVYHSYQED